MPKYRRSVNRNLIFSRIRFLGLTLATLGQKLQKPRTKSCLSKLLNLEHPYKPNGLILEISELLNYPDDLLFPFIPIKDSKAKNQDKSTAVEVS
jgi:hypothetical protein